MKNFLFIILLLTISKCSIGQTVTIENDSVLISCRYNDFISAIKKDNTPENSQYRTEFLQTINKRRDTILITNDQFEEYFGGELDWLLVRNKLHFFDRRTNKSVIKIARIKKQKHNNVVYDLYIDAETKNKLFCIIKKQPSF